MDSITIKNDGTTVIIDFVGNRPDQPGANSKPPDKSKTDVKNNVIINIFKTSFNDPDSGGPEKAPASGPEEAPASGPGEKQPSGPEEAPASGPEEKQPSGPEEAQASLVTNSGRSEEKHTEQDIRSDCGRSVCCPPKSSASSTAVHVAGCKCETCVTPGDTSQAIAAEQPRIIQFSHGWRAAFPNGTSAEFGAALRSAFPQITSAEYGTAWSEAFP